MALTTLLVACGESQGRFVQEPVTSNPFLVGEEGTP